MYLVERRRLAGEEVDLEAELSRLMAQQEAKRLVSMAYLHNFHSHFYELLHTIMYHFYM